jgi:hypothetical protein
MSPEVGVVRRADQVQDLREPAFVRSGRVAVPGVVEEVRRLGDVRLDRVGADRLDRLVVLVARALRVEQLLPVLETVLKDRQFAA